jgi:hypothetical protein
MKLRTLVSRKERSLEKIKKKKKKEVPPYVLRSRTTSIACLENSRHECR